MSLCLSIIPLLKGRFQSPIQHIFKYTLTWFIITHLKHHKNITSHTIGEHHNFGNDSNLLRVFYVQIMPDDIVMQLHRF